MSTVLPNGAEPQSLTADEFVARALAHVELDYQVLPVGKRDKRGRFKAPWVSGHHGYDHKTASCDEIATWPAMVADLIANGNPGILSLGLVLPPDIEGIDVDAYDGKRGLVLRVIDTFTSGWLR